MTLKSNLPQFVAEEKYTSEILDAIEPEIENIKLKLSKILLECSISTCSINGVKGLKKIMVYHIIQAWALILEEKCNK